MIVDFVSCDDEWCLVCEDVDRFNGLWLQAFHDVNDENSNVCKSATTVLVMMRRSGGWCIDKEEPGDLNGRPPISFARVSLRT